METIPMAQEEEPDIISLMAMMEEMAGISREEYKRIPGERCLYEIYQEDRWRRKMDEISTI